MRAALALALLAVALLASGCGERREPTGATLPMYPVTVTDASGAIVQLDRAPARIVALTPAAGALVRALGLGSTLVGTAPSYYGKTGALLLARVRAAKPDLILTEQTGTLLDRRLTTLHLPLYFDRKASLDEVERTVTQLGLLLARPVEARALVAEIEAKRALVAAKLASLPKVGVFVDTGYFVTVSARSFPGTLIAEAHGVDVAGDTLDGSPFDPVALAQANPAVYLATSDSGTTLAALRKSPQTRGIAAVRTGRFRLIDPVLLEPGPGAGDALLALARLLHPDAFR